MAKKAKRNTPWIVWAVVIVLLGAIGWKFFGSEITGSKASTVGGAVYFGLATNSPTSKMMLGSAKNQLDSIWRATFVPDEGSKVEAVALRRITFSVASSGPGIARAYLRKEGSNNILSASNAVGEGSLAIKTIVFDIPGLFPLSANVPASFTVSMDYERVEGAVGKLPNDSSYKLFLASTSDVRVTGLDGMYAVEVKYDGVHESSKHYLFKSYLEMGLNSGSPSGTHTRQANDTIAKYNLKASSALADVGFASQQNDYIRVYLIAQHPTGKPTAVYLKDGATNATLDSTVADLSQTGKATLMFKFTGAEMDVPAAGRVLRLVTDTTTLIGEVGIDLTISVAGKDAVFWGVGNAGVLGRYGHGDIMFPDGLTRTLNF